MTSALVTGRSTPIPSSYYIVRSIVPWTGIAWESADSNEVGKTAVIPSVPSLTVWGTAALALVMGLAVFLSSRRAARTADRF